VTSFFAQLVWFHAFSQFQSQPPPPQDRLARLSPFRLVSLHRARIRVLIFVYPGLSHFGALALSDLGDHTDFHAVPPPGSSVRAPASSVQCHQVSRLGTRAEHTSLSVLAKGLHSSCDLPLGFCCAWFSTIGFALLCSLVCDLPASLCEQLYSGFILESSDQRLEFFWFSPCSHGGFLIMHVWCWLNCV
jgi:hypothetical protein